MNQRFSVLAGVVVVSCVTMMAASSARSQLGVAKNDVALQATTPGASQSGNSNISGTARAGTLHGANLTVTTGAAAGKVLKSDAFGNATWQDDGILLPAWIVGSTNSYTAMFGLRNASTHAGVKAIYAEVLSSQADAAAIVGEAGSATGVFGVSSTGTGVLGRSSFGAAGKFEGMVSISGRTYMTGGANVSTPSGDVGLSVYATGANPGTGVFILSDGEGMFVQSNSTGNQAAGNFRTNSSAGTGVLGVSLNTAGGTGVAGSAASNSGIGVRGENTASGLAGRFDGKVYVNGQTSIGTQATNGLLTLLGNGADVVHVTNSGTGRGIFVNSPADTAIWANTSTGVAGIDARNARVDGYGIIASNSHPTGNTMAVAGSSSSPNGWGVFAFGRTGASGTKSFRIDHPLDPANRYLYHYASESPEPVNFYTGNVVTNAKGEAWVTLPDYFSEINRDFRYTLTVVEDTDSETFVLAKVARKIQGNRFKIRTSEGGVEVSWRVDAVRNDRWMQAYGAPVEQDKPATLRGTYQHPELYGQPATLGELAKVQTRQAASMKGARR